MTKQTLEWHKAQCPECGREYDYLIAYKPDTCGNFDCVYKHHHKEALERIAKMKGKKAE